MPLRTAFRRDGDFGAIDNGGAAADARRGDVGADERLGEAARLVGRGAPFGVDAAVGTMVAVGSISKVEGTHGVEQT